MTTMESRAKTKNRLWGVIKFITLLHSIYRPKPLIYMGILCNIKSKLLLHAAAKSLISLGIMYCGLPVNAYYTTFGIMRCISCE